MNRKIVAGHACCKVLVCYRVTSSISAAADYFAINGEGVRLNTVAFREN